jgi:hypothetical protein
MMAVLRQLEEEEARSIPPCCGARDFVAVNSDVYCEECGRKVGSLERKRDT